MNNNYNIIRILRERVLRNSYPSYHAPLVFDINTQRSYRKPGYVAWPEREMATEKTEAKEKVRNRQTNSPYFAYPQK